MMDDEGEARVQAAYGENYHAARDDQTEIRPGQSVPHQPEHPTGVVDPRAIKVALLLIGIARALFILSCG